MPFAPIGSNLETGQCSHGHVNFIDHAGNGG